MPEQRGLRDQRPSSQLGLSRPLHVACTHSPWHIQSLPHAHLHAKLPALAGEPGPPPALPLLCTVVGERARAWGCPGGGWAGAGAAAGAGVGGKWALGTKGGHPRSGPESSGKGGKGFSHSPQLSLNEGI